jgi:hypothetical protein
MVIPPSEVFAKTPIQRGNTRRDGFESHPNVNVSPGAPITLGDDLHRSAVPRAHFDAASRAIVRAAQRFARASSRTASCAPCCSLGRAHYSRALP